MLKLIELALLCPSIPSPPTCCLRPLEPPLGSSLFLKTTAEKPETNEKSGAEKTRFGCRPRPKSQKSSSPC